MQVSYNGLDFRLRWDLAAGAYDLAAVDRAALISLILQRKQAFSGFGGGADGVRWVPRRTALGVG